MLAMILAAGQGERMGRLTQETPKPLLKVNGKPLIVYQIESLAMAGVKKIIINTGRLGELIQETIGSGKNYDVEISYSNEGSLPLETAGGVMKALPLLGEKSFILTNADIFTDFDYNLLPKNLGPSDAHIVLVSNPKHNQEGDFVLTDGQIFESGPEALTYSGIGLFHPRFFKKYMPKKKRYPLAPLLRKSIEKKTLSGQKFTGLWFDIGTPERLDKINKQYTRNK